MNKEEIIKEFDKRFKLSNGMYDFSECGEEWVGDIEANNIKDFWFSKLAQQREEILGKMMEGLDELTIAKSWELDKDKFYFDCSSEDLIALLDRSLKSAKG